MADSDHESCTPVARAYAVEQLAALSCATSAEMLAVIAVMDRSEDYRLDGTFDMASWLVATLNITHPTARAWVRVARALADLPALRACYAAGEYSWDQIAAATRFATPDTDALLAEELLGSTAAEIEELARQRRKRTRQDAERSHQDRSFTWRRDHQRDGYRYRGFLPAAEAEIVNRTLERQAGKGGPDAATGVYPPFHQRTADALVDLCRYQHATDPGPEPALAIVHVDADVLDGIVDGNGSTPDGMQVPLDTVHRLMCDCPIEFHIDGPDGTCIGIGRRDRTPPRWLRRRIHRRDRDHCRFPGCGRRIRHLHHIQWWARDHGPTDSWNLAGLCWAHHHLVHEGGWTIKGNADQHLTFTSPYGRSVTSRAPPLLKHTRNRVQDATGIDLGHPDAT